MTKVILEDHESRTIFPGYEAQIIHTERMTLAYVSVEAGAELPEHNHHNEQVVNVLDGEFELIVEGTPHLLTPGVAYKIAPNVKHAGRARSQCRILDVFSPVREDWL